MMEPSDSNQTEEENDYQELEITDKELPLCFYRDSHLEPIKGSEYVAQIWRNKERMKTMSVALVLCLNFGVDPPDIVKTTPAARMECWIDPQNSSPAKTLEKVGATLQLQYERWQPRARYKQCLDPTVDDVKKLCYSMRKVAKEERCLFHYNGHGVPQPTKNGEIWVFNRQYTQYIPLSLYDLQTWMGSPSIYVYDCSNAGTIVKSFETFAKQHENEYEQQFMSHHVHQTPPPKFSSCIQLAACDVDQLLPMKPDLPADLFTCCLTAPIKTAIRWYLQKNRNPLTPDVSLEEIDLMPGSYGDRKTMRGELNWIFTAVTDTIAWNTLPTELFQRLFRQDLLVASLFRNFLLAERVMRSYDCTPVSSPALPPTHEHPMWDAWDYALDLGLAQLKNILYNKMEFAHLPFFQHQLQAFQVWLDVAQYRDAQIPPRELPIVLQVLLSQIHRLKALELLGRFLDLGQWAVNSALSVGIFPYVLKLLQSSALELRPPLVYIWSKILAVDITCQTDLTKEESHRYFLKILQDSTLEVETRTQAVFCLASIAYNYPPGQQAAKQASVASSCLENLNDSYPELRRWLAICLGMMWDNYDKVKWICCRDRAHDKLFTLLEDPNPEVRTAAVYALGTFVNATEERTSHANVTDQSVAMMLIGLIGNEASPMVRVEIINALQYFVLHFESSFMATAAAAKDYGSLQDVNTTPNMKRVESRDLLRVSESTENMKRVSSSSSIHSLNSSGCSVSGGQNPLSTQGFGSVYHKVWTALTILEADPHPQVAAMAAKIINYIKNRLKDSISSKERGDSRNSSISLPPSPNRGNFLVEESPPNLSSGSRTRRHYHNTINEEADDRSMKKKKRLVSTEYVEWSLRFFAESSRQRERYESTDPMHQLYYERDWRFLRNSAIRQEAMEEQKKLASCKLESQVFNTRTPVPPLVLKFHPYEQSIAVAGKNGFSILDWGTGAKNTTYQNTSSKAPNSVISALEWMNSHDVSLIMAGISDGSIKVFKPVVGSNKEPQLVSAWSVFADMKSNFTNLILSWEQWTQTVITASDTKVLRFWDTVKELKAFDLYLGTDSPVTCMDSTFSNASNEQLSSYVNDRENACSCSKRDHSSSLRRPCSTPCHGYVVVGLDNGWVRLFDRRCNPLDGRVRSWDESGPPVLGVKFLRENLVMSGSAKGDVKLYDIRMKHALETHQVYDDGMLCFDVHSSAGLFACGSANQPIGIYNLQGTYLNSIKFYEGFMGHRIGPVSCIGFHPHKVILATGTSDCSISVYGLQDKR
ncbi:regulatory-associated protein of mTOR isoform X2 [Coccinella septempunctata]|uniref:regulatory-associated protein of mTOR isoform X2 n=1 Tax=Coccinella septempunctata TaxID=41139 RepID=UPI001D0842FD|nr:regulatory-associated protein of mTOR isoform X2 [Coccinella septempunctata]